MGSLNYAPGLELSFPCMSLAPAALLPASLSPVRRGQERTGEERRGRKLVLIQDKHHSLPQWMFVTGENVVLRNGVEESSLEGKQNWREMSSCKIKVECLKIQ